VVLAYAEDGPQDAPAVLFIGPLGTTLELWTPQVAKLAGPLRLVRVDLRGHGASAICPGPYDIAGLAGDALDTLDALDIGRTSVVGLSIGGMIGQWLAAHLPERVEKLVVLFSAAAVPSPETFRRRAAEVRTRGGAGYLAAEAIPRWLTEAYRNSHPETVQWLSDTLASIPAEGYASCAEALANADLRPVLSRIVAETLVVGGAQDGSLPPACASAIADGIPGARYELLDPAGHLGSIERADTLNEMLLRFLTSA
jgi:3-oxoadipate enol-lactonase